jgi:hypothetical protein
MAKQWWWSCLLLWLATACGPSEAERLVDQSLQHLQAAEQLLVQHHGDERALLEAALHYRGQHSLEFKALREKGETVLRALPAADRERVTANARSRAEPIVARISQAAQKYPDPRRALALVRPLVVAGTPSLKPGIRPRWMPPEVPPPPELGLPGAVTAVAPPHPHVH